MYISLNWIKEFVDLDGISVDELVKRFGLATAEVEGVEYKGKDIENVVVAKILSVVKHPNSDHLHILTVDDGSGEPVQVVCGAPNVRVGLKTFFARVGGNVCGNKIKLTRLAGVESCGMCCGGNELGIEDDTSGIVELPDDYEVGKDIKEILPVEDAIIEIDNKSLTNRPDLWGHYGIAREFAAIFKRELKPLQVEDLTKYDNLPKLNIKVETPNCFRYSSITVDNVLTKKSPALMKLRLNYCGMRDINLLADMTNYLMLEIGQPMHAFDNKIVKGIDVIQVDEPIDMLTLEGETHKIDTGAIVICDEHRDPVAIAGIKGGLKSGISDDTNSLLLESACFEYSSIRKTSRKIGLITDASLRYEKSLDPELCPVAIKRLVYLLKDIEPRIKVTSSLTDVYNYKFPDKTIDISLDFIRRKGGVNFTMDEVVDHLTALEFDVKVLDDDNLRVHVPSFRATKDVSIKEDLIEEIYRLYGYDNINSQSIEMPLQPVAQLPSHILEYGTKHILAEKFGLSEVHTYLWNYEDFNEDMGIESPSLLHLVDASKSGQSGIRSELLPSLIKVVHENKNKYDELGIFEIGRAVDELDENNIAVEKKKLAIVLASEKEDEKALYFKLKSMVEMTAAENKIKISYNDGATSTILHPKNSCLISCGEITLGQMGVMHPTIVQNVDKRKKFAALELDLNKILDCEKESSKINKTSKYQSVSVDYNFVMDKTLPYSTLENTLNEFRANYILEHSLKDVYVDDEKLNGKISYTINFIITPKDKTLETSDIEKFSNRLIQHVSKIGVSLRA